MAENDQTNLLPRAYYSAPVGVFLASTPETILGFLVANSEMAVEPPQAPSLGCFRLRLRLETRRGYGADKSAARGRDAWQQEIAILKSLLQSAHETRQVHEMKSDRGGCR
jgi:hypothetical protein